MFDLSEEISKIDLTEEQQQIEERVVDWLGQGCPGQYIAIAGYAGTGKTTLLGHTAFRLVEANGNIDVRFLTFTGKASSVLGKKLADFGVGGRCSCSTIHSYMYRCKGKTKAGKLEFDKKHALEIEGDVLVVDEASMLSTKLFRDLLSLDRPIIFVGDPGQLPPINDSTFQPLVDTDLVLKTIHRQALDNPIIQVATHIRKGKFPRFKLLAGKVGQAKAGSKTAVNISKQFKQATGAEDSIILCAKNKTRIQINNQVRDIKGYMSEHPLKGERLVCLKNDKDKGLMNGQCVYVESCDEVSPGLLYLLKVRIEGEDRQVSCYAYQKSFNRPAKELGSLMHEDEDLIKKELRRIDYMAADEEPCLFDFGYALSVHKAQGSEWDKVLLIAERMLSQSKEDYFKWLYTGVTRAKDKLFMVV